MSEIIVNLNDDTSVLKLLVNVITEAINLRSSDGIIDTPVAVAPVAVAPVAVAPVAVATNVELDKKGIPWDERIHASTKTKKGNGEWKIRRGVPKETIDAVMVELVAAVTPPPAADPIDPDQAAAQAVFADPAPVAVAPVDPVAVAPVDPVAVAPVGELTWPILLNRVVSARNAQSYDESLQTQFLATYNLSDFAMLSARPDLFEAFIQATGV